MHFCREVSDRVIFMDGGFKIVDDIPAAVFDNPENKRLREFLSIEAKQESGEV